MVVNLRILSNALLLTAEGRTRENQALVIENKQIIWCGNTGDIPSLYLQNASLHEDCQGTLLTPALIDCHTHLVYAGNRAHELKRRLEGASYADIAREGGGILSTVKQTRAVSEEELFAQSLPRILALRAEGVSTVEIKSGYGLDLDTEIKMLRVAKALGAYTGMRIKTTFLGAHALPPEFKNNKQAYVDYLCQTMLPAITELKLVDAVDVFSESIGFDLEQSAQIFETARAFNLELKCHAEQLSNIGASALAASMNALSCDHLEFLDDHGAAAMAKSGTIAVLLPGAFYFLGEKKKPPIALLRQYNIPIAVATDSNPGSSPTTSLHLMMNMACQLFSLTVPEVWAAVTINAAKALGIAQETGILAPGFSADLVRWSINDSAALCYYFGYPIPHELMIGGEWIARLSV